MPGWEGDAFEPARAQADMLVQIGSDDRGVGYLVETSIRGYLAPAFAARDYETGFGMPEGRGLTGFIDGAGNPHEGARIPVALIGDEDQRWARGSYLVFRRIREDLAKWDSQTVEQQEEAIGRVKMDSAPLAGGAPLSSHKGKSSIETKDGEIQMVRRSFPCSNGDDAGLLFFCWVRDPSQFVVSKTQMLSNTKNGKKAGKDELHAFSTPVTGGYYFAPPQPDDDGYLGDFLFRK